MAFAGSPPRKVAGEAEVGVAGLSPVPCLVPVAPGFKGLGVKCDCKSKNPAGFSSLVAFRSSPARADTQGVGERQMCGHVHLSASTYVVYVCVCARVSESERAGLSRPLEVTGIPGSVVLSMLKAPGEVFPNRSRQVAAAAPCLVPATLVDCVWSRLQAFAPTSRARP